MHRSVSIISSCADNDLAHCAASRWKLSRIPIEKTICSEGLVVVSRCIKHHLDNAFDITIRWRQRSDVSVECSVI